MAKTQQQTLDAARKLYNIAFDLNQNFASVINTMIDGCNPPESYAPFIDAHAEQTRTLTRLLYMIGTWEAEQDNSTLRCGWVDDQ